MGALMEEKLEYLNVSKTRAQFNGKDYSSNPFFYN